MSADPQLVAQLSQLLNEALQESASATAPVARVKRKHAFPAELFYKAPALAEAWMPAPWPSHLPSRERLDEEAYAAYERVQEAIEGYKGRFSKEYRERRRAIREARREARRAVRGEG